MLEGQSPSRHGFRDQNRMGRETFGQYASINPAEPGLFGSVPLVRAQPNTGFGLVGDPCQTDRENSTNRETPPHRKQKEPDKYDGEKVDQVSREQFVRGLSDIDMKRHVDLRNPSSLEEAISLATQFESFDLGESQNPIPVKSENRTRGRTAPVQVEERGSTGTEKELASLRKQLDTLLTKVGTMGELESKLSKLSEQVEAGRSTKELEGKLSKLSEQVENLTKRGLTRSQEARNSINRSDVGNRCNSSGVPKGNCFGCGQPGHYKNSCPKSRNPPYKQKSSRPVTQRVTDLKGGWLIQGSIQGVEVEMLVDSGSDVTLIDERFFKEEVFQRLPLIDETTPEVEKLNLVVAISRAMELDDYTRLTGSAVGRSTSLESGRKETQPLNRSRLG